MVFVPDRKQARLVALDLISSASNDNNQDIFLGEDTENTLKKIKKIIKEDTLKHTLTLGVGFIHEGLSKKEIMTVKRLYSLGIIK